MSYGVGRAALTLQPAGRVARTEYNDNWELVRHYTGRDPRTDASANRAFHDAVGLDVLWWTDHGPVSWETAGRTTNMGHAAYVEDGSDFVPDAPSPFRDAREVLAFRAPDEYGLPDLDPLVTHYRERHAKAQAENPNQVVPGGYYRTLLSGAIQAFGWERLLEAAAEDPEGFGRDVLGSFFELSLRHYRAWAETGVEFFISHDDMVWTRGPFMRPAIYRKFVFPRYAQLWRPLKEAGVRVLYCSDGTFDMFLDDLVQAGADGFIFEPSNDLAAMVRRVGSSHVLVGGMDCRTLLFKDRAAVEAELARVLDLTRDCPGFVLAAGNHLPPGIPLENATAYFDLAGRLGARSTARTACRKSAEGRDRDHGAA